MPHIRLLEVGFNKLTGHMGQYEFKDGVSVENLTEREANVLCSSMRAETVDGENVSIANMVTKSANVGAISTPEMQRGDSEKAPVSDDDQGNSDKEPVSEPHQPLKTYTFDELAAVADKGGIAGIREIASKRNVTGRSINDLIEGVLKAQLAEEQAPEEQAPEEQSE